MRENFHIAVSDATISGTISEAVYFFEKALRINYYKYLRQGEDGMFYLDLNIEKEEGVE